VHSLVADGSVLEFSFHRLKSKSTEWIGFVVLGFNRANDTCWMNGIGFWALNVWDYIKVSCTLLSCIPPPAKAKDMYVAQQIRRARNALEPLLIDYQRDEGRFTLKMLSRACYRLCCCELQRLVCCSLRESVGLAKIDAILSRSKMAAINIGLLPRSLAGRTSSHTLLNLLIEVVNFVSTSHAAPT
jgi:hypothetical protein